MTDLRKAAEMALERLESHEYWMDEEAIKELRQALAQPEQKGHCTCGEPEALGVVHFRTRPCFHYIHQPKREWVGLTRRELDIATLGLEDLGDCYKAIEAKLKEKNT